MAYRFSCVQLSEVSASIFCAFFTQTWVDFVDRTLRPNSTPPNEPVILEPVDYSEIPPLVLAPQGSWDLTRAETIVDFALVMTELIENKGLFPGFVPDEVRRAL